MRKVVGLIIVILAVCASCTKRVYEFRDINTGVIYEGSELVLADRDLGADAPGKKGEYFNWWQARKACPKGYHLMTVGEAKALISDKRYNSSGKLVLGNLQMVQAGYGKYTDRKTAPKFYNVGNWADYHLYEEFDKKDSWYLSFDITGDFFGVDYLNKKDLLTVRCVKGGKPSVKTYKETE